MIVGAGPRQPSHLEERASARTSGHGATQGDPHLGLQSPGPAAPGPRARGWDPARGVTIPTLDQLADDPVRAHALPLEIVMALALRCAALQATLAARLTQALLVAREGEPSAANQDERLLTPQEASAILNVRVRWLYRHAGRLPFTRRLSRKRLRFSEAGLRRYLETRRG